MNIHLILMAFVLSALLGCVGPKEKASPTPTARTHVTSDGPKRNNNMERPKAIEQVSGKYNIQSLIQLILPPEWKKERWFVTIDNKNGYAKMGGYMEGYYAYYLFVGKDRNLLIETIWGCGPACEQTVIFHEINGSTAKLLKFEDIASAKVLKTLKKQIANCSGELKFNEWTNKNCEMMFDFPHIGKIVTVYKAKFLEDNKYQGEWGGENIHLARLKWDRHLFKFDLSR
ncbi:MAG: hypothetical protein KDD33_05340 [Bdellovibrionales bacterium]|nr:hypothetical protein [Bdellovibrionales bacterium]